MSVSYGKKLEGVSPLDGAEKWSYPPRDYWDHRPTCIAYPDCLACKGQGRIYVSRPARLGGYYWSDCSACRERYNSFKDRAECQLIYGQLWKLRHDLKYRKWQKRFNDYLRSHGIPRITDFDNVPPGWKEAQALYLEKSKPEIEAVDSALKALNEKYAYAFEWVVPEDYSI